MEEDSPTAAGVDAESAKSVSPSPMQPHMNSKGVSLTGTDCAVCKDQSVPGTMFRRHYGVICCEACKCFFRRTVQMSRDYKCRFGGSCYIGRTTENLKQVCQACRFNQCILTGMKLDSVKRFPRKPRNQKTSNQEEGTPSVPGSKTTKKSNTKQKRQKNGNQQPSKSKVITSTEGELNGTIKEDSLHEDHLSSVGAIILSPGGMKPQDEELALSDTDLANVKFKLSPSEAMLYLQSTSTTVSQLFKYDSLDSIHEKTAMESSANVEGVEMEGHDAQCSNSNVSGSNPCLATSGVIVTASGRAGVNGCGHYSRRERGLRGKRGPEEVARAENEREEEREEEEEEEREHMITIIPNKKQCMEYGGVGMPIGSVIVGHSHYSHARLPSGGSLSTPPLTPISPSHSSQHSHSRHSSCLNSPEAAPMTAVTMAANASATGVHTNNMSAYTSPYVTPHSTPVHTPYQSPLPSPSHMPNLPPQHHLHPSLHMLPSLSSTTQSPSGKSMPVDNLSVGKLDVSATQAQSYLAASSPSMLNSLNLPGFSTTRGGLLQIHQQHNNPGGTILFNSPHTGMPIQVLAPATALLPATMVLSAHPAHPSIPPHSPQVGLGIGMGGLGGTSLLGGHGTLSSKSPFRIVPIPSINRTQPEELPSEMDVERMCDSPSGHGDNIPGSTASSACPSPVHFKAKPFSHLAEAKLEEVLDSLRLRIRSLFMWAKSDVPGFDDLSPLDQKALLRRTVPELVMLGFARGSIAYDDLLLLGSTGKVIRPSNQNNGVASVALVTLQKLVVPLKVLNINDRELALLKEIVLFNPESNGLRNREVVRQFRKQRHLKLMEYTEKCLDDPSRFGELMCLLTPLFEVSTEVTEQLRLEQFVHEGEARIDALLLMSMINVADEMPDVNTLDSQL